MFGQNISYDMTAKVDLFKRHQDLKQSYPALSEIHKNK